jgi:hypothetical protein
VGRPPDLFTLISDTDRGIITIALLRRLAPRDSAERQFT